MSEQLPEKRYQPPVRSLEDFLAAEGILRKCEAQAVKALLAMQIRQEIERSGLTKVEMARRRSPPSCAS